MSYNGFGAGAGLSPDADDFKSAPMSNVKLKINRAFAKTKTVREAGNIICKCM
jgi:hypothetical protein